MCKLKLIFLLVLYVSQVQAQTTNITGPAGSGQFGYRLVTVLSNGNFVVIDPLYDDGAIADVGAVYLYNGSTLALISTLTGSKANDLESCSITPLNNSNYLVYSRFWDNETVSNAGALTWCNGTTGISGVISSSNSLVGSSIDDQIGGGGITILSNGNYLVSSPWWDNGTETDAGAATWGSATSGVSGVISSSNSIVGSFDNDWVGSGIAMLSNGNYLVISPYWRNGTAVQAGAVTWGNGATGVSGVVSSINSLVGSSDSDRIGNYGITELSNGNYLVRSTCWENGSATYAGAITWCSGTTGLTGAVSSSNSLVGSTTYDQIGTVGIYALSNSNYLVSSPFWDNGDAIDAGAVTWCNGTTSVSGVISSGNSLVGSTTNDQIGWFYGRVTILNNGNYVVSSPDWDNGILTDVGAVTWCNGTTGTTGVISSSNSLIGSTSNDRIGGVFSLGNGNYLVASQNWDNGSLVDVGIVTWVNGNTGISGVISTNNSMVGSTANDRVGVVYVLDNGNYLVRSRFWDNGVVTDAGAVTWGNGTTGITGVVSSSNSLVGGSANDQVGGDGGIAVLSNGNYVVATRDWDNGIAIDAGAVTWCNGTTGTTGIVSSSNSLVGSIANDRVGGWGGITPLSNGNYVVPSRDWGPGDVGAVTWCNGTTGTAGVVSSSNSLVGSQANDQVGSGTGSTEGIIALSNGNYVVSSPYCSIGAVNNAGAVTFCNGTTGTAGVVSSSNSLVGSSTDDFVTYGNVRLTTALSNGNYLVASPNWNNGAATNAGELTWGNGLTGISGVVSSSNSLVGTKANDEVGAYNLSNNGITILSNGKYLAYSSNWDNGLITDAEAVTWGSGTNPVVGNITSCNSVTGSVAVLGNAFNYVYNNIYDYLIVGRPSESIVSIYNPVGMTLASTLDNISTNINGNTATPLIASAGCRIIATLTPNGASPVNGTVNAKAWIESTVPTQSGNPFVARHYEITPVTNASTATGMVTLYFTQQEFNDFNAHAASTLDLPTGEGDATGKTNLRIYKYPGTSSDGSGLPVTYSGAAVMIDPNDADINWNNSLNRWEISFNVTGFSGFFVQTNLPLPLTLLEFNGHLVNNNGILNWKTTDEVNTFSFDIERSTDGRSYSTVGNVAAVNQPGNHQYNYTDQNITSLGVPVAYYRLKQIDIDGRFTYSRIIALSIDNSKSIVLFYPNPVINEANLMITVNVAGQLRGRIIDNTGRVIKQQQWNVQAGNTSLTVNVNKLAKGMYYFELKGKKINESIKFVKQ